MSTSPSYSSLKKARKQILADTFAADTSSAYLPTHFTNIQATVYDLNTNKQVATGNYGNHVVPKGQNEPVTLPVTFSYTALNTSDTTCEWGRALSDLTACRSEPETGPEPENQDFTMANPITYSVPVMARLRAGPTLIP